MPPTELLAFVRSSLPTPPARILEIGAGRGELAHALGEIGYAVTAIDPTAGPDEAVQPLALIDVDGHFDAALAVVSLHHVDPLEASCAHLAQLLAPGALLVIDEIDCDAFDATAAAWWLAQRATLGSPGDEAAAPRHGTGHEPPALGHEPPEPGHGPSEPGHASPTHAEDLDPQAMAEDLRHHIHSASRVRAALQPHFALGAPARGPYLYRWELRPSLYAVEVDLIAAGRLPAVGWRQVAVRR